MIDYEYAVIRKRIDLCFARMLSVINRYEQLRRYQMICGIVRSNN